MSSSSDCEEILAVIDDLTMNMIPSASLDFPSMRSFGDDEDNNNNENVTIEVPKISLKRFDSADYILGLGEEEDSLQIPQPKSRPTSTSKNTNSISNLPVELEMDTESGQGAKLLAARAIKQNKSLNLFGSGRDSASAKRHSFSPQRRPFEGVSHGRASWSPMTGAAFQNKLLHTQSVPAASKEIWSGIGRSLFGSEPHDIDVLVPRPQTTLKTAKSFATSSGSPGPSSCGFKPLTKGNSFHLSAHAPSNEECLLYPVRVAVKTAVSPLVAGSQMNPSPGPVANPTIQSTPSSPASSSGLGDGSGRRAKDRAMSMGDERSEGWTAHGQSSRSVGCSGTIQWRPSPLHGYSLSGFQRDRAYSDSGGSFTESLTTNSVTMSGGGSVTDSDHEHDASSVISSNHEDTEEDEDVTVIASSNDWNARKQSPTMRRISLQLTGKVSPDNLSSGATAPGLGSRLLATRALQQHGEITVQSRLNKELQREIMCEGEGFLEAVKTNTDPVHPPCRPRSADLSNLKGLGSDLLKRALNKSQRQAYSVGSHTRKEDLNLNYSTRRLSEPFMASASSLTQAPLSSHNNSSEPHSTDTMQTPANSNPM